VKYGEILSRDEIQHLLERNNRLDHLGRPEYVLYTRNDGRKRWTWGDVVPSAATATCDHVSHQTWLRRLASKKWRVQPGGANSAYVVERPTRSRGEWRWVPLNARA
jgi:hypothetical protein